MVRTALQLANPLHRRGWFALPHLLLLAALLACSFAFGWWGGSKYTAQWYSSHYAAPLPMPKARAPVFAPPVSVPLSASITWARFNPRSNDQGPLGSCQAWAAAKQLSYAYNVLRSHYTFFSPRFLYDLATSGNDQGSYLEQYPPIAGSQGVPTFSQFPYGPLAAAQGLPAYADDPSVSSTVSLEAESHRLQVTEHPLFAYPGAGPGGLALIQQAVAAGQAANLDLPVYPEFDRAGSTGWTVDLPQPGEQSRGGHAVTVVGYKPGWVEISNQWGPYWGFTDHAKSGNAWLSDAFIEQEAWGVATLSVAPAGTRAAPPRPRRVPLWRTHHPRPLRSTPPPTAHRPLAATSWYLRDGLRSPDTGADLSPLLNAAGDRYHLWPLALAALAGVESSFHQYADRYGPWCDVSFGLTQETVCTASGYGVGNGSGAATPYVRWYEDDPARSIALGAHIWSDYQRYRDITDPTLAYGLYNCGPAAPLSWLIEPGSACYQNEQHYAAWLSYLVASWQGGNPTPRPTPTPFPRAAWCAYSTHHHLRCPAAAWHGHRATLAARWAASAALRRAWGAPAGPEQWNARRRVMTQPFQGAWVWSWPAAHGDPMRWRGHPWLR